LLPGLSLDPFCFSPGTHGRKDWAVPIRSRGLSACADLCVFGFCFFHFYAILDKVCFEIKYVLFDYLYIEST
jgi:hypothetical protein